MSKRLVGAVFTLIAVTLVLVVAGLRADEFTQEDLDRWEVEYMSVVTKGRDLWVSPDLSSNEVACAQCHPNAANTHPENYPKFQQQLGRVVALRDMINWCIENPLEGDPLALDDPQLVAMEAYIAYERREVPLAPGAH